MAHFATKSKASKWAYELHLAHPRACVTVKVVKLRPVVLEIEEGSLKIASTDAAWIPLPEGVVIQGSDGEVIQPTGRFYVSTETFDPCHLVTDVWETTGVFR